MQCAGHQFFSGSGLALDQDGAFRLGDFPDQPINRLHFGARANEIFKFVLLNAATSEDVASAERCLMIQSPLDAVLQFIAFERLCDVSQTRPIALP